MSERSIEQSFRLWCKSVHAECLKLLLAEGKGFPDRTVLLPNGKILFIEFKDPKTGRVSPHQILWIRKLRSLGHDAFLCDDLERAKELVRERLSGIPEKSD